MQCIWGLVVFRKLPEHRKYSLAPLQRSQRYYLLYCRTPSAVLASNLQAEVLLTHRSNPEGAPTPPLWRGARRWLYAHRPLPAAPSTALLLEALTSSEGIAQ